MNTNNTTGTCLDQTGGGGRMNIVVIGHVDHGKSTLIGRLLADTGSLPEGKLKQVEEQCRKNARPFEYAFLLDALKDEQSQGITIDVARCFFKTPTRHYIIIDAPGHVEFLKNMVTGASRAEAALLLIDASEGIRENSKRHGYLVSLLGIRQIAVIVNKMDLVNYDQSVFTDITNQYLEFLKNLGMEPTAVIPVSGRDGDTIVNHSSALSWYTGPTVLETLDGFRSELHDACQPFRFPVQDVYKFTEHGDDRRIFAGRVETGSVSVGDEVVFLPSEKHSVIQSIEAFNEPKRDAIGAGYATGFTLATQVYIKPGEIMCRTDESLPCVVNSFRANIFWVGKNPMITGKRYKLKTGTASVGAYLGNIRTIVDTTQLDIERNKQQIDRHDVADCVIQTIKPIAVDPVSKIESTGRFVIVDDYEIAGGGIITEVFANGDYLKDHVRKRETGWVRSDILPHDRINRFRQRPRHILITGTDIGRITTIAKRLEEHLYASGRNVYFLGIANLLSGVDSDLPSAVEQREEHIRRLGELAYMFNDAGMILISVVENLDRYEFDIIKTLIHPFEPLLIAAGDHFCNDDTVALQLTSGEDHADALDAILVKLYEQDILIEYSI